MPSRKPKLDSTSRLAQDRLPNPPSTEKVSKNFMAKTNSVRPSSGRGLAFGRSEKQSKANADGSADGDFFFRSKGFELGGRFSLRLVVGMALGAALLLGLAKVIEAANGNGEALPKSAARLP